MYYIFMPEFPPYSDGRSGECDAYEEVHCYLLPWQPGTGDSVDGTCIENLVLRSVSR